MARKNVSKREYLNAAGEKSVGPDAQGVVNYHLLGADGNAAKVFTFDPTSPGAHMFAQFGFVTKIGNEVNSVLNGDDPGTVEDAIASVEEFLAGVAQGQWREPGEGKARGPKYDKDVLASTLFADRSPEKRTGDWADVATIRARLDNDKSFFAKVRNNAQAMASYHKEMAARGAAAQTKGVDDLD